MTPEELFEHRLASLLGLSLGALEELPQRELDRWARYWSEEPWGTYRDNMHAALIIRELLKPHLPENSKVPPLSDYMFEHEEDRKQRARQKLLAELTMVTRKRKR